MVGLHHFLFNPGKRTRKQRSKCECTILCSGQELQTKHVHSPDGSTFLCEVTSWAQSCKYDIVTFV